MRTNWGQWSWRKGQAGLCGSSYIFDELMLGKCHSHQQKNYDYEFENSVNLHMHRYYLIWSFIIIFSCGVILCGVVCDVMYYTELILLLFFKHVLFCILHNVKFPIQYRSNNVFLAKVASTASPIELINDESDIWYHIFLNFSLPTALYKSLGQTITHPSIAYHHGHINGLVQDCSNSSALAMELLQSCTKPPI